MRWFRRPTLRDEFVPYPAGLLAAALALSLTACSSESSAPGDPAPGQWAALIEGAWSLEPGLEAYYCVRQTVAEDVWIRGFRPNSPPGIHHSVLSIDEPGEPDGLIECHGSTQGKVAIFAAGVGTQAFELPDGIATKIPAGKQLLLNLHVFNTQGTALAATSSVEVMHVDRSKVVHEAEAVYVGKTATLAVLPGRSTQTGTCSLKGDVTIFAVVPHMHQLGTHMTTTTMRTSGAAATLLDRDYDFDEQTYTLLDVPVALHEGDRISVACTYENPGATTVGFGMSSNDEMCFTGVYWYPSLAAGPFCFDD